MLTSELERQNIPPTLPQGPDNVARARDRRYHKHLESWLSETQEQAEAQFLEKHPDARNCKLCRALGMPWVESF